jgi:hypothetical protein
MADELAHLAQADRHIARAKEHIRQQEQLIERLIANGRNVDEAENFLSALTNVLSAFGWHRRLILVRLRA